MFKTLIKPAPEQMITQLDGSTVNQINLAEYKKLVGY